MDGSDNLKDTDRNVGVLLDYRRQKNNMEVSMRYSLKMINRNGYEIKREAMSIKTLKEFAKFYPLSVFFAWIYDKKEDKMICQNLYTDKWVKCSNETFVPYY